MSKFHVGDRVRIHTKDDWDGNTGVVERVPTKYGSVQHYDIRIEGINGILDFAETELRPADIMALVPEDATVLASAPDVVEYIRFVKPAVVDAVDSVNHPPHYNRFPVEVINITEQLDFNKGNAVKYLARAGYKDGVDELEDLSKAAWYVNRAIEKLKKERGDGK